VTVELKEDRIAGVTVDLDLRLRTGRAAWPLPAWFETRSRVGCRLSEIHLVRRLSIQRFVRTVLIVPIDDEFHFVLEIRLVLGHCDQKQYLLERSMETFNNRNGAMLLTAPNRGRILLALHQTFSKCSHLNSGPWSTIKCFGRIRSSVMIRSNAAVISSDVGLHGNTANPMDRREK
jgi:hypothetical protein